MVMTTTKELPPDAFHSGLVQRVTGIFEDQRFRPFSEWATQPFGQRNRKATFSCLGWEFQAPKQYILMKMVILRAYFNLIKIGT